jgi:hypothetical protein
MSPCRWFILLILMSPAYVLGADEGIPEKRLQDLKAATVYVKVEGKQGMVTGSGFLIHVSGETGLVATNRHVIAAIPGRFTPKQYSLVFHSGTRKEQVLPGEIVAISQEQDLDFEKGGVTNAPRIMQEVEGDFVATVRVTGDYKLGPKGTNPKSDPMSKFISGGILLWSDANNHIRLERCLFNEFGKYTTIGAIFEEREGGYAGPCIRNGFNSAIAICAPKEKGTKSSALPQPMEKFGKTSNPSIPCGPRRSKSGSMLSVRATHPLP